MGRPRTAVAQWHALKAWGTQGPTCLQFFLNSAGVLSTYLLRSNCSRGLQTMCVISLFSGLFDILFHSSLNFTLVELWIPLDPTSSPSLTFKRYLMSTQFLLVLTFYEICFSRCPSVFILPCQTFPVINMRAAPLATREYKLLTKNGSN